jgi:hypothetical protein
MEEKNYALIMALFDPENQLGEFCSQLMDEMDKQCGDEFKDMCPEDIKSNSRSTGLHVGFATGFVLGQMLEVNDEETAELVTDLKRRMKEKRVLPWQPRALSEIQNNGLWGILDDLEQDTKKVKGILSTLSSAFTADAGNYENMHEALTVAEDLNDTAREKVIRLMDMAKQESETQRKGQA